MDAPASAGFSGAIKIGDISDFISPAQACVVGLGAAPSGAPKLDSASIADGSDLGGGGVVRAAERPSSVLLAAQAAAAVSGTAPVPRPSVGKSGAPVKVTLNDCLACSGCVTSAETVLLEAQSAAELDAALSKKKTVVVTLSQQSVGSLAGGGRPRSEQTLSPSEAAAALCGALRSLGVAAVIDAGEPRALALLASAVEFCAVYAASPEGRAALRRFAPRAAASGSLSGVSGAGAEEEGLGGASAAAAAAAAANAAAMSLGVDVSAASSRLLPCLASACPGWVCYAEKNAAAAALPHAASAASAQAVAGLLVKRALLSRSRNGGSGKESENEIFHVSVMPCADKKLESLRDDLVVALEDKEGGGAAAPQAAAAAAAGAGKGEPPRKKPPPLPPPPPPGTDCVLTTIELSSWLLSKGVPDLRAAPRSPLDSLAAMLQGGLAASKAAAAATAAPKALLAPSAGTSGGFGEFVFRHAASTLFGVSDLPPGPLPWKSGRNGDVREVALEMKGPGQRRKEGEGEEGEEGAVVLRVSLHYGFRNIQTLVNKIKSGSSHSLPHFVEVMACPSGCVNGGGQLRGVASEGAEGEGAKAAPPPDGRALAAAVYSSLAEELRPEGSDWYSSTLSSARALAGVAWPRGKVEPAGALTARVRDRKAEAEAAAAANAASVPAPAPMSVDW